MISPTASKKCKCFRKDQGVLYAISPPKLSIEEVELDINYDVVSDNNSHRDLPKFATFSQKASTSKPQHRLGSHLRQIMLNRE